MIAPITYFCAGMTVGFFLFAIISGLVYAYIRRRRNPYADKTR